MIIQKLGQSIHFLTSLQLYYSRLPTHCWLLLMAPVLRVKFKPCSGLPYSLHKTH